MKRRASSFLLLFLVVGVAALAGAALRVIKQRSAGRAVAVATAVPAAGDQAITASRVMPPAAPEASAVRAEHPAAKTRARRAEVVRAEAEDEAEREGEREGRRSIRELFEKQRESTLVEPFQEEAFRSEGNGYETWFYGQRAYPADAIPLGAQARALGQAMQSNGGLRGAPGDPTPPGGTPPVPTWISIGPSTIPNGQVDGTAGGPPSAVSGRVSAIAVHPSNGNIVYVGGAQGGVWKSTNALAATPTWTPLTDHQPSNAVGDIAIDPVDPNIVYVGTGEANGSADSYYGRGILRSADGGLTWTVLTGGGGSVFNNTGPFLGKTVSKIVIDPATAGSTTGTTLWASTTSGATYGGTGGQGSPSGAARGVWRSTDSGATWTRLAMAGLTGDGTVSVNDLALDPLDSNILYAAVRADGIWKSVDAKVATPTFTRLSTGFPVAATASPVMARITLSIGGGAAGQTLYAAINDGVGSTLWGFFKTIDGGANWSHIDSGNNGTANVVNAGANATLTRLTGPTFTTAMVGRRIIIGNRFSRRVTSVTPPDTMNITGGAIAGAPATFTWSVATYPRYCEGQCFYDMTVGVDPTDPTGNTVYVGGNPNAYNADTSGLPVNRTHSVWRSLDGGSTWRAVSQSNGLTGGVHTDDHEIVFDATVAPARVYDGNDGGLWSSSDQGVSWKNLNTNLTITQFQGVSTHPSDPTVVIGGTQDNGTNLQNPGLLPPSVWFHSDGGDGGQTLIDQASPNKMFHTYFNQSNSFMGPAMATDGGVGGGASWDFVGGYAGYGNAYANGITMTDRVGFYAPLAQNPAFTPNNVIYFGSHRLYRAPDPHVPCCPTVFTTGCGFPTPVCTLPPTWTLVSPELTKPAAGFLSAIAALPTLVSGNEVVYTGSSNGRVSSSSNVNGSGIATWNTLDALPGTILPNRFVTDVEVAATDATGNTAYVTFSGFDGNTPTTPGHLFKTVNGLAGAATVWTNVTGDLPDIPVTSLAVDYTVTPAVLYAGTDLGVFQSLDDGGHWLYLSTGHPVVASFEVERNPRTGQIISSTHGRGMFQLINNGLPDNTPPVCGGSVFSPTQFNGNALDAGAGDTGIANIALLGGSTNLTISNTNFTSPGSASFQVNVIQGCMGGTGTVEVTDYAGNSCTIPVTLTGTGTPASPVASSNSPVFVGETLMLFASTVPSATYSWTGPNGFTSTLQNPTIPNVTLAAAGTYSVVAIVSGCSSAPATTNVVVLPPPANNPHTLLPDGRATTTTMLAASGIAFKSTLVAGRSYSVEVEVPFDGQGTVSGGPSPNITLSRANGSAVTGTVTNGSACAAAVTKRLTFVPSALDVAAGPIKILVSDTGTATDYRFRVRLVETSLYEPWWTTTGYLAFVNVQNATDCPVAGTVDLLDASGAVLTTFSYSLNPNGAVQFAVPGSLAAPAGSARLRHDGGPGAVTAGIYMVAPEGGTFFRWPFIEARAYGSTDGK